MLTIPSLSIIVCIERLALGTELIGHIGSRFQIESEFGLPEVDVESDIAEEPGLVVCRVPEKLIYYGVVGLTG